MNFSALEKIADAVLYEGYILYPYRPSSIKNQQRWNFGTLYPRAFAESQQPNETFSFQAEILVEGSLESAPESAIDARIRFLQLVPDNDWEQGFARSYTIPGIKLSEICASSVDRTIDLSAPSAEELAKAPAAFTLTPLTARITFSAQPLAPTLFRVRISLANESPLPEAGQSRRQTLPLAFNSAHLLLHCDNGNFVSLLEPPENLAAAASACTNRGVFPVLAGENGDRTHVLCSPIILYDYPQVAPESAGDFFDGTEMDEMLALRVMTLTDDEKAEMRGSDVHARAILDRTETLPQDQLLKVHGAVRGMHPSSNSGAEIDGVIDPWDPFAERPAVESVRVFGIEVRKGDRVRLWPQKKADIMDMAMQGKVAVIEAIEQDLEDNIQFAVVLEDDPGKDMGMLRQAGHRFFFSPEEVEPLGMEVS